MSRRALEDLLMLFSWSSSVLLSELSGVFSTLGGVLLAARVDLGDRGDREVLLCVGGEGVLLRFIADL